METRIPPTERCPFSPTMPAFFASAMNCSSSSGLGRRKTTFITDRLSLSTGDR